MFFTFNDESYIDPSKQADAKNLIKMPCGVEYPDLTSLLSGLVSPGPCLIAVLELDLTLVQVHDPLVGC